MESARKISNPKLVEEKLIVKYKSDLFDITNFISKHPGGVNTLNGYNQKNIEEKFHSVEHSPAAKYLLNEYKISTQQLETNNNELDESMEVSKCQVAVEKIPIREFPGSISSTGLQRCFLKYQTLAIDTALG
jgi:cytochrome b involved in lipid metabolism